MKDNMDNAMDCLMDACDQAQSENPEAAKHLQSAMDCLDNARACCVSEDDAEGEDDE